MLQGFGSFGDDMPVAPGGSGASTARAPLPIDARVIRLAQAPGGQPGTPRDNSNTPPPPPATDDNKTLYYVIGGVALLAAVGVVLYMNRS